MDKYKWQIWPPKVFWLLLATGLCSTLVGALLAIVCAEVDSPTAAMWLERAAALMTFIGVILLLGSLLDKSLEWWAKRHLKEL